MAIANVEGNFVGMRRLQQKDDAQLLPRRTGIWYEEASEPVREVLVKTTPHTFEQHRVHLSRAAQTVGGESATLDTFQWPLVVTTTTP